MKHSDQVNQQQTENKSRERRHFGGRTAALQADQSGSESDEGEMYTLTNEEAEQPRVTALINRVPVNLLVDTGASVTVVDRLTYERLGRPTLKPSSKKIKTFQVEQSITIIGVCETTISSVKWEERKMAEKVYVMADTDQ